MNTADCTKHSLYGLVYICYFNNTAKSQVNIALIEKKMCKRVML